MREIGALGRLYQGTLKTLDGKDCRGNQGMDSQDLNAEGPIKITPDPASLGLRLGAAFIDTIVVWLPLVLFVTVFDEDGRPPNNEVLILFMVFLVGLGAIQIVFLSAWGQSVGKKIVNIRIIKLKTGENGGFVTNVLLRGFVSGLISAIPILGFIYGLIDILFIFSDDRRCIHDHIAGTVVIDAR